MISVIHLLLLTAVWVNNGSNWAFFQSIEKSELSRISNALSCISGTTAWIHMVVEGKLDYFWRAISFHKCIFNNNCCIMRYRGNQSSNCNFRYLIWYCKSWGQISSNWQSWREKVVQFFKGYKGIYRSFPLFLFLDALLYSSVFRCVS